MRALALECRLLAEWCLIWIRHHIRILVLWLCLLAVAGVAACRFDHPVMEGVLAKVAAMHADSRQHMMLGDGADPAERAAIEARIRLYWHEYLLAGRLREWGAFVDILTFSVVLLLVGRWWRSPRLTRAACACLVGGLLAGVAANSARLVSGRPRPRTVERTGISDGFYGPHPFAFEMCSFPSGHVAASTGGAVALATALPLVAPVVLVSSAGVVWACVRLNAHWVSDAAVGVGTGVGLGLLTGLAARRRRDLALGARLSAESAAMLQPPGAADAMLALGRHPDPT